MVRLQTLDLRIGVRVPASQPVLFKTNSRHKITVLAIVSAHPNLQVPMAGDQPMSSLLEAAKFSARCPTDTVDEAIRRVASEHFRKAARCVGLRIFASASKHALGRVADRRRDLLLGGISDSRVTLLASLVPAMRASRVEPMEELRDE